jgi:Asp-tRNA(Asn)/Glu-tRNA(Gln) amidotransferase A subunit family amidase
MLRSLVSSLCLAAALETAQEPPQEPPSFQVMEATISEIHAAIKAGQVSCRGVVEQYLRRIEAYDKNGPAINAIVVLNPNVLTQADDLDARHKRSGMTGPLHCIPVIVKDNFETVGLQSAAGSLALAGFVSTKDAFQVRRIKEAGAVVLAKSNMAEWAFTPYETVSSILPGYTRNPYALERVTAGSSGGTAAAVAASMGAVGLGSDTGNSIRGPSSHQSLVGIRSTMGLTSRGGVVPLNLLADIAGPMTRTVADAAAVFQVIVGADEADPITLPSSPVAAFRPGTPPTARVDYLAALVRDGLKGARLGVLRQAYERETTDSEIVSVFQAAIDDMKQAGATIVDPVVISLDDVKRAEGTPPCGGFKYDLNRYLAAHGSNIPVKSLDEVIKSRRFHPTVQRRLEQAKDDPENGPETAACIAEAEYRSRVRTAVLSVLDAQTLDALIYPTWSNPPRLTGDLNTPHGDNSQFFSPTTGFPAVQVPMGYTRGDLLPAGLTIFGRPWDEARLIKLAYSYEQATHHRRPPPTTPPLR